MVKALELLGKEVIMKYFCIADVHGCYDRMMSALYQAGFNKEKDTLVSLGDLFDRGPQSKEVLEFVMSCPHRLLCMGNHDLRLMQLIKTPYLYNQYDGYNGVPQTYISFIGAKEFVENNISTWDALIRLRDYQLLKDYFHECRAAFEFSNLVITHGWIPVDRYNWKQYQPYLRVLPNGEPGDWRDATNDAWDEALWADTEKMIEHKMYLEKPLLIGHWHAWRLAEKFGEKRQTNKHDKAQYIDCSSFSYWSKKELKFIAIDGCSNWPYGGKVNVYTFKSDEEPNIIFGGLGKWYY